MSDVVTLGCRLNGVESDRMAALAARAAGDLSVVNTCAVTAESQRKSLSAVRRALRDRPDVPVVVTGCASELSRDTFASLSPRVKILANARKTEGREWEALLGTPLARMPVAPRPDADARKTRGFVAVQTGCDHRCTFCTIPFGRGASRSVPLETAVAEVRVLVEEGYLDVTLTGVDLTAWGLDLSGAPRLGDLVRAILRAVPHLPRLRLSSLDCIEADRTLLDVIAHDERLMPHLHLSFQSGDDLVLKRMKRRHSRRDALRFCENLRRLRPDLVFGADLIAGFPTETDAMFANTLRFPAECGLTFLHVFPYSPRPDTPAARMPPVEPALVARRAALLREEGVRQLHSHLDAQVGRTLDVLVERGATGRTADFTPVRLPADVQPGVLSRAKIDGHDGARLVAAGAFSGPVRQT